MEFGVTSSSKYRRKSTFLICDYAISFWSIVQSSGLIKIPKRCAVTQTGWHSIAKRAVNHLQLTTVRNVLSPGVVVKFQTYFHYESYLQILHQCNGWQHCPQRCFTISVEYHEQDLQLQTTKVITTFLIFFSVLVCQTGECSCILERKMHPRNFHYLCSRIPSTENRWRARCFPPAAMSLWRDTTTNTKHNSKGDGCLKIRTFYGLLKCQNSATFLSTVKYSVTGG